MGDLIPFHYSRPVLCVMDHPAVDVTAGLDGYRLYIHGKVFCEVRTATAAYRLKTALETLHDYGLLDRVADAQGVVRRMLEASLPNDKEPA